MHNKLATLSSVAVYILFTNLDKSTKIKPLPVTIVILILSLLYHVLSTGKLICKTMQLENYLKPCVILNTLVSFLWQLLFIQRNGIEGETILSLLSQPILNQYDSLPLYILYRKCSIQRKYSILNGQMLFMIQRIPLQCWSVGWEILHFGPD